MFMNCNNNLRHLALNMGDLKLALRHTASSHLRRRTLAAITGAWAAEELSEYVIHLPDPLDERNHIPERADAIMDVAGIAYAWAAGDQMVLINRALKKPFCILDGYTSGVDLLTQYAPILQADHSWRVLATMIWGPISSNPHGLERWRDAVAHGLHDYFSRLSSADTLNTVAAWVDSQVERGRDASSTWSTMLQSEVLSTVR